MSDSQRWMRIEMGVEAHRVRLEHLITVMGDLVAMQKMERDLVVELVAWLKREPKSDIEGILKEIVALLHVMGRDLPAAVARAVKTGEI